MLDEFRFVVIMVFRDVSKNTKHVFSIFHIYVYIVCFMLISMALFAFVTYVLKTFENIKSNLGISLIFIFGGRRVGRVPDA